MANTLLTDQHITQEALMILENNLTFTKQVTRKYAKEFTAQKRGATIFVRRPPRYTVRDGQAVAIQDTTQSQVPLTLSHQFGVDVEFYSQDLALSISDFGRDILQPQIVAIANAIDASGLMLGIQVPSAVGTPGTTPGTGSTAQAALAVYGSAAAVLDKQATPRDGRRAIVINEDAQAVTVPNLAGLFNPQESIAKQYSEGSMGRALGFKWSMDQNVYSYSVGAQGGTPVVSGTITPQSGPSGTSLSAAAQTFSVATSGWTANTQVLNAGDVVSFAGCYQVNPVSHLTTNRLKQFCLAQAATSNGSGNATLVLTEPMIATGAYQNVSAVPANNAAITVLGAANTLSPINLAFHQEAFTFASVDLPLPGGVHMAARKSDDQLGISMRFVAAYNVSTDQFIGRFDVLCGWALVRPEWAVRIAG